MIPRIDAVRAAPLGLLALVIASPSQAQYKVAKPALDYGSYAQWSHAIGRQGVVSPNGKYLSYDVTRGEGPSRVLVVESVDGKYKREFPGGYSEFQRTVFSADNRRAVLEGGDSTIVIDFATQRTMSVPHGQVSPSARWLSWLQDTSLVITDLSTGHERRFALGGDRFFVPSEKALVVAADSVVWIDLTTGRATTVHRGPRASELAFDTTGTRLAFVTEDSTEMVVRVYEAGQDSARALVGAHAAGLRSGDVVTNETPWFGADGSQVYFKVAERAHAPGSDSLLVTKTVDVWHYRDRFLQSQQLSDLPGLRNARYTAVAAMSGGPVISLESQDTALAGNPGKQYALMKRVVNIGEEYWSSTNPEGQALVLVALRDGRRTPLPSFQRFLQVALSPDERFVVGFDPVRMQYISYEVATGVTHVITQDIPVALNRTAEEGGRPDGWRSGYGIAGWVIGDSALLIYDQYDVWQVDLLARTRPINLTAAYGRAHKIVFRFEDILPASWRPDETVVLKAVDETTRDQGYWTARLGRSAPPSLRYMGPYIMGSNMGGGTFTPLPVKAANAGVYLLVRQTERDAPNWFVTTDLQSYRRLTNLQPHEGFNWLTSELLTWTLPDGRRSQGILYKPENFDPAKKYPVIVEYYEKRSNELHLYRKPELSVGRVNIPWYVSNGYLVFVPDIPYYILGRPAKSVAETVVSGADYLATFPWVDSAKMGIQGHSFGGYETMAIVALSHRFAAANAAAGKADLVSDYGTPALGGKDDSWRVEFQQMRMGTTPWTHPELYVESSPVFHADSITTPLLLMHSKNDDNVQFEQSVEMFIALRRLQKPVWLLQYDRGDHTLGDTNERRDYTIRMQQFFDHYLKGAPAPVWMTQGIPASAKGQVSGLEYDRSGRAP